MFKVKIKVDCVVLFMICNSLFLPFLSYCCEIRGNTYESRLHELIILQKRVIRVIGKVPYLDHTSIIFKKFRPLKLRDIMD